MTNGRPPRRNSSRLREAWGQRAQRPTRQVVPPTLQKASSLLPQSLRLTSFVNHARHRLPAVPKLGFGSLRSFWPVLSLLAAANPAVSADSLPRLRVSENHHFLVTDAGRPFFWLGDTAWE